MHCEDLVPTRGGPEFRLTGRCLEPGTVTLTEDHPLLWPEAEPFVDVDIAVAPRVLDEAVVALLAGHERSAGPWLPAFGFLRAKSIPELRNQLAGGSCNLGYMPTPLAGAYEEVLREHGCRPTVHGDGGTARRERRALLFGDGYVLAARFRAERLR